MLLRRGVVWLILLVMGLQIFTHVFWLSLSTQSGQTTVPWLMNHGYTLFDNAIEQRAPLSAVVLAAAQRVLPLPPDEVVRWLNIALVLVIDLLVFGLARRFGGTRAGMAALLVWAWWEPVFGNVMFYFDTLLGLGVLAGLFVLAPPRATHASPLQTNPLPTSPASEGGGANEPAAGLTFWRCFFAGICLGTGVMFKQHGIACAGALGLWLLMFARGSRIPSALAYAAGVALPVGIIVGVIAAQGNLDTYLYWNFLVNFEGKITPAIIEGDFIRRLMLVNLCVLPFALLTLRNRATNPAHVADMPLRWGVLVLMLWAGALLPLVPHGGEIHAMTFLPLTALMSGIVISSLTRKPLTPTLPPNSGEGSNSGRIAEDRNRSFLSTQHLALSTFSSAELTLAGILALMLLVWGFTGLAPQMSAPIGRGAVIAYDEFLPLAEVIRERANPDDRLFILPQFDGTPQILVETGLLPPGTWTNHDGVFLRGRDHLLVNTMLAELEAAPPRFIVYFPDHTYVRDVRPAIEPLIAFIETQPYTEIRRFESIPFNGEAIVYEYQGDS
jgi:hypothetical protein